MKKIPAGAEASNILVGELECLEKPVVAFVRLSPAVLLNGLAEVPITTRSAVLCTPECQKACFPIHGSSLWSANCKVLRLTWCVHFCYYSWWKWSCTENFNLHVFIFDGCSCNASWWGTQFSSKTETEGKRSHYLPFVRCHTLPLMGCSLRKWKLHWLHWKFPFARLPHWRVFMWRFLVGNPFFQTVWKCCHTLNSREPWQLAGEFNHLC